MYKYEFSLLSPDILSYNGSCEELTPRFAKLVEIAKRLVQAKWYIQWTVTGLAFREPYEHPSTKAVSLPPLSERLHALGITETFVEISTTRSLRDVLLLKAELEDRVWYAAADAHIHTPPPDHFDWEDMQYFHETLEQMPELERYYGRKSLVVDNPYARGVLNGRLQALRWILGKAWPDLNDEVEHDIDAKVDAECDRDYHQREKALDTICDMVPDDSWDEDENDDGEDDDELDAESHEATLDATLPCG